jgi:hypothetical protein
VSSYWYFPLLFTITKFLLNSYICVSPFSLAKGLTFHDASSYRIGISSKYLLVLSTVHFLYICNNLIITVSPLPLMWALECPSFPC